MKKPHEQEWEHTGSGAVWNKGRTADLVHAPTEGHAQSKEEVQQRGDLIAAAPDMARALMRAHAVLAEVPDPRGAYDAITDALTKAKVIR